MGHCALVEAQVDVATSGLQKSAGQVAGLVRRSPLVQSLAPAVVSLPTYLGSYVSLLIVPMWALGEMKREGLRN